MKKFYALLLAGVCVCLSFQQARATPESQAAVLLLLTEPGARAIAMGESYVAISDDATVNYFNPATLAGQTKKLLNFTHSEFNAMPYGDWQQGNYFEANPDEPSRNYSPRNYKFLAYAQPVEGWGNIGLNIALLNFGDQVQTGERGQILGDVSFYDVAVSAAYGLEIADNMSVGIGLKFIRSRLSPDFGAGQEHGKGVGNSFATDLGLLWKISPTMTFGTALRNLGPKIAYIDASQADPLPQHIVAGLAYKALDTEFNDLLFSVDLYKPLIANGSFASNLVKAWADESLGDEFKEKDLHIGVEYKSVFAKDFITRNESFFAMRGGYSLDRDGESKVWTVGVGLKYNMFQVDVAYYGSPKRQQERVLKSDHLCLALTL